ncbi:MAG: hypothetical protein HY897_10130 [Deltaproteobacteria bacterium]|nr:hypothetical protein [Deltaproteobacteria bacterium]
MKSRLFGFLLALAIAAAGALVSQCTDPKNEGAGDGGETDGHGVFICKNHSDCDTAKGEVCQSGKCGLPPECSANADCKNPAKACCSLDNKCVACEVPDGGDGGGGDDGGGGGDVPGCQLKTDCPITQWCEKATGTCKDMGACRNDEECASGHMCNAFAATCECINDDACKDWPDNKTSCDFQTKTCSVYVAPQCDPACDASCKECVGGTCQFLSGKTCCNDDDCLTPPYTKCDLNTYNCVEEVNCGNACSTDDECKLWCKDTSYVCSASTCIAQECITDGECATICGTGYTGTCVGGSCSCTPVMGGLCADCSIDPTACDASGLTCGSFTKKCTRQCASSADCVDDYGQPYVCQEMLKMCNCNAPSCCQPACPPPQVCDETLCTCS